MVLDSHMDREVMDDHIDRYADEFVTYAAVRATLKI